MDLGEFNGRSLYNGLMLDYRLRVWAPYIRIARYLCSKWASCYLYHQCHVMTSIVSVRN